MVTIMKSSTESLVWSLVMIKTITDNRMVSMKYLAAAILFDDFSLMVAF